MHLAIKFHRQIGLLSFLRALLTPRRADVRKTPVGNQLANKDHLVTTN